ncbi:hypothetical protein [Methanothermococcus sp.]|uniref:hypothetical protein n=1 Tax=Methanothermococcus sp. TaxID=2614238 RepID=UPI0025FA23BF|nr:hypothetical protein [Methanothermococcus sp.]
MPNENKLFINFLKENSNKYFPDTTANLIDKVLSSELLVMKQNMLKLEHYWKDILKPFQVKRE